MQHPSGICTLFRAGGRAGGLPPWRCRFGPRVGWRARYGFAAGLMDYSTMGCGTAEGRDLPKYLTFVKHGKRLNWRGRGEGRLRHGTAGGEGRYAPCPLDHDHGPSPTSPMPRECGERAETQACVKHCREQRSEWWEASPSWAPPSLLDSPTPPSLCNPTHPDTAVRLLPQPAPNNAIR